MKLTELGDRELIWVESAGREPAYSLRAGGEHIGHLTRSRATGELEGHRWVFEHAGFTEVIVRADGSSRVLATFSQRWKDGGLVKFTTGRTYCWTTSHIWSTTYLLRGGEPVPSECITHEAPSMAGSRVTVCAAAACLPETPVLVLLGWFLEVGARDRVAIAATAW
jgi:hypothetical protein